MFLKKGWPAIRAAWLWKWQEDQVLETNPLFSTRVLIVAKNARPAKSYCRRINSETVKFKVRYWLGKGTILVPYWKPLKLHYDPVADRGLESLNRDEQKVKGIYRLDNGELLVLIYQHVEDALYFQRQQWHILLENYPEELQKISSNLAIIEDKALESSNGTLCALGYDYRNRRQKIHQIMTKLAAREKAAEILLRVIEEEVGYTKRSLRNCLNSRSIKDFLKSGFANTQGLKAYLVRNYLNLGQMGVRPIVKPLGLAQYQIRAALGSLDVLEVIRAMHHLELAIQNLEKAEKTLKQP